MGDNKIVSLFPPSDKEILRNILVDAYNVSEPITVIEPGPEKEELTPVKELLSKKGE